VGGGPLRLAARPVRKSPKSLRHQND
jgi:hypothetical protein